MPHRSWMTTIHRRQAKTWPNRVVGLGNQIGAARKGPRRRCMNRAGDPPPVLLGFLTGNRSGERRHVRNANNYEFFIHGRYRGLYKKGPPPLICGPPRAHPRGRRSLERLCPTLFVSASHRLTSVHMRA
jgi:hypothetical protein